MKKPRPSGSSPAPASVRRKIDLSIVVAVSPRNDELALTIAEAMANAAAQMLTKQRGRELMQEFQRQRAPDPAARDRATDEKEKAMHLEIDRHTVNGRAVCEVWHGPRSSA